MTDDDDEEEEEDEDDNNNDRKRNHGIQQLYFRPNNGDEKKNALSQKNKNQDLTKCTSYKTT